MDLDMQKVVLGVEGQYYMYLALILQRWLLKKKQMSSK
jgi:hypothetical protein